MKLAKSKKEKKTDDSLTASDDPLSSGSVDPLSQAAAEATTGSRAFGAKPWCVMVILLCPRFYKLLPVSEATFDLSQLMYGYLPGLMITA